MMPRFYFDYLSDNTKSTDTEGTVLPDLEAARTEAADAAGEWMRDHASQNGAELVLTVRHRTGCPVFAVSASVKVLPTK